MGIDASERFFKRLEGPSLDGKICDSCHRLFNPREHERGYEAKIDYLMIRKRRVYHPSCLGYILQAVNLPD